MRSYIYAIKEKFAIALQWCNAVYFRRVSRVFLPIITILLSLLSLLTQANTWQGVLHATTTDDWYEKSKLRLPERDVPYDDRVTSSVNALNAYYREVVNKSVAVRKPPRVVDEAVADIVDPQGEDYVPELDYPDKGYELTDQVVFPNRGEPYPLEATCQCIHLIMGRGIQNIQNQSIQNDEPTVIKFLGRLEVQLAHAHGGGYGHILAIGQVLDVDGQEIMKFGVSSDGFQVLNEALYAKKGGVAAYFLHYDFSWRFKVRDISSGVDPNSFEFFETFADMMATVQEQINQDYRPQVDKQAFYRAKLVLRSIKEAQAEVLNRLISGETAESLASRVVDTQFSVIRLFEARWNPRTTCNIL